MKTLFVKDTRMQSRLKLLFAWLESAEESGNAWAARTASNHILALSRKCHD